MNVRSPSIPSLLACLLLFTVGCRHVVRLPEPPVSVLVGGPVDLELLPRTAALVEARREQGEAIWLIAGPVLADTLTALVTEGRGPLRAITRAGADAAVFGPEMLKYGVGAARRLVDDSPLHLLTGNISDVLDEPYGHPMLFLHPSGTGVGLTAIWTDPDDPRLRQKEVKLLPPDRAAGRVLGLLRMHSELTGIILQPGTGESAPSAGYDFAIGPKPPETRTPETGVTGSPGLQAPALRTSPGGRVPAVLAAIPSDPEQVVRVDLYLTAGRISDWRVVLEQPADWPEQETARQVVDSLHAVVDSVLSEPVADLASSAGPVALDRMLAADLFERGIDAVIADRAFFKTGIGPGLVSSRSLIAALEEPGRLGIVELTGWQLEELLAEPEVTANWRPGLSQHRLEMPRRYRVAATPGFLTRHPRAAVDGSEADDEPAWRAAARLLAERKWR